MKIDEIVDIVNKMNNDAREKAELFKKENEFIKVKKMDLSDMTVGSVDGGLLKKSYHPFDLVIVTSLGVIYNYGKGSFKVSYYPSKNPKRDIEFYVGKEFKFFSNLSRVKKEITTSLELVNKFDLSALLLDGSIVPYPSLKPNATSKLYSIYEEILDAYERLYNLCQKKKCLLAGIVKDSRSSKYFENFRDTFILSYIMHEGERTKSFKYQETNVSDLKSRNDIFSFYLKSNKKSRPLRIDFYGKDNEEKISELIYTLSSFSNVGIPNVILECDKRVKLREYDLARVEKSLYSRFGINNFFLRRNGNLF